MPPRQRQSGASSAATPRRAAGLPPYQPPAHPLNAKAQRELEQLLNINGQHSLKNLSRHLELANVSLNEGAVEINDSLAARKVDVRKIKARREKQPSQDEAEDARIKELEQDLEAMTAKVGRMTKQMEEGVRKTIDGQHLLRSTSESVKEIANNARVHGATQATQQNTQGRSQRRRRETDGDEEDDGEEEYQDFTPTDPAGGPTQATQQQPAPSAAFKDKMDKKKDRYQNFSLHERYAQNNDYRHFRRLIHDAQYPDGDAPELGDEATWFTERGVPAPGVTTRRAAAADDDDDDDLAIAKETISTKCPLTLMEFKDPVTSRKCPHSFEREAITGMIDEPTNAIRLGGAPGRGGRSQGGERAVQCPVSGCTSMLTKADLHADPVLKRKIARIQRANAMAEEDDEDEDGEGRVERDVPQLIGSDDGEGDGDLDQVESSAVAPKVESSTRPSQRARRLVVDEIEDDE